MTILLSELLIIRLVITFLLSIEISTWIKAFMYTCYNSYIKIELFY